MQKNLRKNILPSSNKQKYDFINFHYNSIEKYYRYRQGAQPWQRALSISTVAIV